MFENNRVTIPPPFPGDERLFFRAKADDIDFEGNLKPNGIRCPDQSVNCASLSEPYDVLIPEGFSTRKWLHEGVFEVRVRDVPPQLPQPGGPIVTFVVEHAPLANNYGHAEMRAFRNANREKKVHKAVVKQFKTDVALKATMVFDPANHESARQSPQGLIVPAKSPPADGPSRDSTARDETARDGV